MLKGKTWESFSSLTNEEGQFELMLDFGFRPIGWSMSKFNAKQFSMHSLSKVLFHLICHLPLNYPYPTNNCPYEINLVWKEHRYLLLICYVYNKTLWLLLAWFLRGQSTAAFVCTYTRCHLMIHIYYVNDSTISPSSLG